MARKITYMSWS